MTARDLATPVDHAQAERALDFITYGLKAAAVVVAAVWVWDRWAIPFLMRREAERALHADADAYARCREELQAIYETREQK